MPNEISPHLTDHAKAPDWIDPSCTGLAVSPIDIIFSCNLVRLRQTLKTECHEFGSNQVDLVPNLICPLPSSSLWHDLMFSFADAKEEDCSVSDNDTVVVKSAKN